MTLWQARQIAVAIAAAVVAGAALFVLARFALARPLCCADDASFAVVSKNLADGLGYLLTLKYFGPDFSGSLFDPQLGTGPTSILPVAVAIRMFGASPSVPGLTHIFLSVILLATAIVLATRRTAPATRSAFLVIFLLLAASTGAYHLEQWYAQLGEVLAALLICAGAVIWSSGRNRIVASAACGIAFGCAVMSKHLAALYLVGPALVAATQAVAHRRDRHALGQTLQQAAVFAAAAAAPVAAFELWKLTTLGAAGWAQNWKDFLEFLKYQGLASTRPSTLIDLLAERAKISSERFGVGPAVFLLSLVAIGSSLMRMDEASRRTGLILLTGLLANVAYWIFASNGWPRYVFIALVVYCYLVAFVLSVSWSQLSRVALLLCVAWILATGLPRLSYQWELLKEAQSSADSDIRSAKMITAEIKSAGSPAPVITQWWAHVAALEYLARTPGQFRGFDSHAADRHPIDLIVVNTRYLNRDDVAFSRLLAKCPTVIANRPPYTVYRCAAGIVG